MAVTAFIGSSNTNISLMTAITNASLTTNLQFCLDAGDSASYTSGQKWLDLSGNGQDFFLGSTADIQSSDPTFNGTPGGLSAEEYFSLDGDDFFRYDSAIETWMADMSQNNAIFTYLAWIYFPTTTSTTPYGLFGTYEGAPFDGGDNGISLTWTPSTDTFKLHAFSNDTANVLNISKVIVTPDDSWALVSVALNEATGASGGFIGIDTTFETFTSTYSSPETQDADTPLELCAKGVGNSPFRAGGKISSVAMWGGTKLSTANVTTLHTSTRTRYGV